jgi:outer membrane protein, heavy metal efflux system
MKYWWIIMGMAGLAGCARFEERPLAPAQTAAQLEARSLADAGLRKFLEQALGQPQQTWPLPEWNLTTLSLAAFYYNPNLAVARAQWEVTMADVQTAAGRPNPSVTATPGYDTTTSVPSPWLPMITFDWPVETAGKRGKRMAEARELALSARWDIVTTAWQVRSTLREALLDGQAAERRRTLLEQEYQLQVQLVQRLEQRLTAGDIARPELVAAQISLQKTAQDRLDAETRVSDARVRLAGIIGLAGQALEGVKIDYAMAANLPPGLTDPEARRVALTSRSDIRGALADYAAAEDDLKLEIAKQYPDVHVGPGYQYNQGDNQWFLGFTVELPVLNQNQGPIASAEAKRRLAAAKFLALQSQVISDIDRALAGYRLAQSQAASGEDLLATEQEQVRATAGQVAAGAADQFDALHAQLELASANLAQLDNNTQVQRARGTLEDALQYPLDSLTSATFKQLAAAPNAVASQP